MFEKGGGGCTNACRVCSSVVAHVNAHIARDSTEILTDSLFLYSICRLSQRAQAPVGHAEEGVAQQADATEHQPEPGRLECCVHVGRAQSQMHTQLHVDTHKHIHIHISRHQLFSILDNISFA